MKKNLLILIHFIFLYAVAVGQTQSWIWARQSTGPNVYPTGHEGETICTDPSGNVYIAGWFNSPTATFGNYTLVNPLGTGSIACYLVKYNSIGNAVWAQALDGADHNLIESLCSDIDGNIYITGGFDCPSINFGNHTLTNTNSTISGTSSHNLYIVKFDSVGNAIWAKSAQGHNIGSSVRSDPFGNVFVGGGSWLGSSTFDSLTVLPAGGNDGFIVKYDSTGNAIWAKAIGGNGSDGVGSIVSDIMGNIIVTGSFDSNPIVFDGSNYYNSGNSDVFIVKYDVLGNLLWVKIIGGTYDEEVAYTSSDKQGNIFITGNYISPTLSFGGNVLYNSPSGTLWMKNFFISKFNASGVSLWARSSGTSESYEEAYSVGSDSLGNAYVTGKFSGDSVVFGSIKLNRPITPLCFGGPCDPMFFVKYSSSGLVTSALMIPSSGHDQNQLALDPSGNVYIVGDFLCDTMVLGNDSLFKTSSVEDIFVAKYGSSIPTNLRIIGGKEVKFTIAPNPVTNLTSLLFEKEIKNATVKMFDVAGNLILQYQFTGLKYDIDLNNVTKGMYIIKVILENGQELNEKLVLQ